MYINLKGFCITDADVCWLYFTSKQLGKYMLKCSKLFLNILYKTRKSKPVLLDALIIPLRKMSLSLDLRRKLSVPPMTEMSRFGFFMSQTSSNKWSTSPIFVSASIRTYYPKINKIPKSNVWYLWFYMIEIELYQKKDC